MIYTKFALLLPQLWVWVGGMMPYIIETSKYEPIGSLAIHNSKRFNPGYMQGIFKCLKANKYDIGVLYERK